MARRNKSGKDDVMSGRTDSGNSGGRRPRAGNSFDPLDDSIQGSDAGRKIRRMETGATSAMRRLPNERSESDRGANSRGPSSRRGATKRLPPLSQPSTGQVPKVPTSASGGSKPGQAAAAERNRDLGVFADSTPSAANGGRAETAAGGNGGGPAMSAGSRGLSQRPSADIGRPNSEARTERNNDSAAAAITAARLPQGRSQPSLSNPGSDLAGKPLNDAGFDRLKAPDLEGQPIPEPSFDPSRLGVPTQGPGPDSARSEGPNGEFPSSEFSRGEYPGREFSGGDFPGSEFSGSGGQETAVPQYASSRAQRQGRTPQGASSLQDTEMKLAGRRRKPKPKEPNKLLLGAAVAFALLIGGAVFYFTRGSDETETVSPGDSTEAAATDEAAPGEPADSDPGVDALAGSDLVDEVNPDLSAPAAPDAQVGGEPTFALPDGEAGPLQAGEEYPMQMTGTPEGTLLQLVVNGAPQEQPAPVLKPQVVLPAGRQNIYVELTGADGSVTASNAIDVYVLGDPPTAGFRANLSSVDMVNEGWAEAIRQYDGYLADGHTTVRLAPSDPYPSLTPGFWNIFVDGFDGREAAQSYCEQFTLAIPDDCFPRDFDPAAPAQDSGATATTAVPADSTDSEPSDDPDAMSDDS